MAQQPSKPTQPNYQRYEVHQSFQGSAYFKDDNIWTYNREFASTFGMPMAGVADLKGAVAAAFRVETMNYRDCGFGGKDENCTAATRPILDIYIDESKNPLPWASEQQADWLGVHSSVRWLRMDIPGTVRWNTGTMAPPPKGAIPNSTYGDYFGSLRPFMDAQTKRELIWLHNGGTDVKRELLDDISFGFLAVLQYKRNALRNLTVLSFQLPTSISGKDRDLILRLQDRNAFMAPALQTATEVTIPAVFVDLMKKTSPSRK
jgi:hypothetical protein